MSNIPRIRHFGSMQQKQDMVAEEYLVVVVALEVAVAVVAVDSDVAEAGELFTHLIILHLQI